MSNPTTPKALQSDSKTLNYFTRSIVVLVAIGAAVLSFDALSALAVASGIPVFLSWIWAVVIDGFIMVATFAAFALKDRGASKYYAWSTLSVFVVFSILGNAWHAAIAKEAFELPLQIAVIVTAIPPLALFLAIHLLVIMVSPSAEQKEAHKKEVERQERINKLKENELEKIEKLNAINEVREEAGLELLTELPGTRNPRPKTKPVPQPARTRSKPLKTNKAPSSSAASITLPNPPPEPSTPTTALGPFPSVDSGSILPPKIVKTQPVEEIVLQSTTEYKTNNEIIEIVTEQLHKGEDPLPAKTISELTGKSLRTSQVLRKRVLDNFSLETQEIN